MRVAIVFLLLYVTLPFVGLYTVTDRHMQIYQFSYETLDELKAAYPVFLLALLASVLAGYLLIRRKRMAPAALLPLEAIYQTRRRITLILLGIFALSFYFSGYDILAGSANRGDIRVSFGGFGFLFRVATTFLAPAALAVSGVVYKMARENNLPVRFPFHHVLLTMAVATMLGYKSVIVVSLIPFAMIVVPVISLKMQILAGLALTMALVGYSSIVLGISNFSQVANYLFLRGTSGTSWGLIASWEVTPEPHADAYRILLPVFGPRVTALLFEIPAGTLEYLKFSAGKYVSYLVHPNPDLVLDGKTNLTITMAGEAVYLFGRQFFWVMAIPVGMLTGLVLGFFANKNGQNRLVLAPFLATAYVSTILPVLNSGGVVALYSAFSIFYLSVTAAFLFLVVQTGRRKMVPRAVRIQGTRPV